MRMSLEDLLNRFIREGKLKRQQTSIDYLNNLLDSAKNNFEAASLIKGKVDEAAFKLVYDGLLQLSRLILLLNGYRPNNGEQHKTTFTVAGQLLGEEYLRLIEKILSSTKFLSLQKFSKDHIKLKPDNIMILIG